MPTLAANFRRYPVWTPSRVCPAPGRMDPKPAVAALLGSVDTSAPPALSVSPGPVVLDDRHRDRFRADAGGVAVPPPADIVVEASVGVARSRKGARLSLCVPDRPLRFPNSFMECILLSAGVLIDDAGDHAARTEAWMVGARQAPRPR